MKVKDDRMKTKLLLLWANNNHLCYKYYTVQSQKYREKKETNSMNLRMKQKEKNISETGNEEKENVPTVSSSGKKDRLIV